MRVFDASAMVYAWDNYPLEQFPPVWNWLAAQIKAGQITMSQVALEEVGHVAPDCRKWLVSVGIGSVPVDAAIALDANRVKKLIGVVGDDYHPDGVDENDLLIIATARFLAVELVSEERQPTTPKNTKRYKIPTVCKIATVDVDCCTFLEFLKKSQVVFAR